MKITSIFPFFRPAKSWVWAGGRVRVRANLRHGAPGHIHGVEGDWHRVPGRRHAAPAAAGKVERHLVAEDADEAGALVGDDHGLRDGHRHGEVPRGANPGADRLHQPRPHGDVQQHTCLHCRGRTVDAQRPLGNAHFPGRTTLEYLK
jgi:hypothetical protein